MIYWAVSYRSIEGIMVKFEKAILSSNPTLTELKRACMNYEEILLSHIEFVLKRFEGKPDYPWIDTKFNLIAGKDFPDDDKLRGPEAVYGWIQGRALESLAEVLHRYNLLKNSARFAECKDRAEHVLSEALHNVYEVRKKNNGHLYFLMHPDGSPFTVSDGKIIPLNPTVSSPYTYTDLFCAKGMLTASAYLNEKQIFEESLRYCLDAYESTWVEGVANDQVFFGAGNPADINTQTKPFSHAPYMLQIGTIALLAKYCSIPQIVEMGFRMADHIVNHHINIEGKWKNLEEYDFVEFIDRDNRPYSEQGRILSDPGHALEFAGLTLRMIRTFEQCTGLKSDAKKQAYNLKKLTYSVIQKNFQNGYIKSAAGICKSFDLSSREYVNSDMPWWSLPETMRAAVECWNVDDNPGHKEDCLRILSTCHNTFIDNYLKPELHFLAVQTRDSDGNVVSEIPATPDLDPGYHTGLSLLDCCEVLYSY